MNFLKWKLLFISAPMALAVVVLKFVLLQFFHFDGFLALKEMQVVLTAGVFLTGFMLAGTMADYKEAEKIPGQMAHYLEAMEELIVLIASRKRKEVKKYRQATLSIALSLQAWLLKRKESQVFYEELSAYTEHLHELNEQKEVPPALNSLLADLHNLRNLVIRTQVISETGFLNTGYALLEILLASIAFLMLITNFESLVAMGLLSFFVILIFTYLYLLIRDIDDPFEYDGKEQKGSAEVALFPLEDYIKRCQSRIHRNF